ncbi:MAG: RagB/SusD family nutrient uptake outer membrane protein, partial [Sphingobacteriales bacterium]
MKRYIKSIMLLMVTGTVLYSCKKDFLNLVPLGQVPESSTWADGPLSEAFVNGLYQGLGQGGFHEEMLSSFSDESIFTHAGRGFNIVNEGTLNPSNTGWGNGNYQWNNMYQSIRPTLIAMTNLPAATFDNPTLRDRLRGEAMFLYAYYNHQILRYYGGGPLINKIYGLDEDYTSERATWAANVDNIVKYCDSAALMLTGKSMQKGRPTATAALALKARVLLYAASDLHDMPTAKAKSTVINGFAKPELLGYVSGARAARWTLAKNAAKAVLDATKGYKLDLTAPEPDTSVATKNYISIAMGGGSKGPGVDATALSEILWGRFFIAAKGEGGRQIGLNNGPNGYNNWAGN